MGGRAARTRPSAYGMLTVQTARCLQKFSFLKNICIYLKNRVTKRERMAEREERDKSSTRWFTPPIAITVGAGAVLKQEQGASFWSPTWLQGPNNLATFCWPSRHISRESDANREAQTHSYIHMGVQHHRWRLSVLCHNGSLNNV